MWTRRKLWFSSGAIQRLTSGIYIMLSLHMVVGMLSFFEVIFWQEFVCFSVEGNGIQVELATERQNPSRMRPILHLIRRKWVFWKQCLKRWKLQSLSWTSLELLIIGKMHIPPSTGSKTFPMRRDEHQKGTKTAAIGAYLEFRTFGMSYYMHSYWSNNINRSTKQIKNKW